MSLQDNEIYEFGSFILDPSERVLSCLGTTVCLTPKAFETLLCLVRNRGRTLTKDELLKHIWPGTFVEEVNLAVNISTVRKALGENPKDSRYIATVPGRGYRFVAEVRSVPNQRGEHVVAVIHPEPIETANASVSPADGDEPSHGAPKSRAVASRLANPLLRRLALVMAIAGVLVVVAVPIKAHFLRSQGSRMSTSRTVPSIAVLPFTDLSPAKDQEYFSEGLAEELIAELAKVPGLKVAARSSAFQFKDRNEDVRSIGKKLGVANVLDGSVQRQGNHLRIRVELMEAGQGLELWSETYDRNEGEIFSVQDEIARAVTSRLQAKLIGSATGRDAARAANQEAYEAYLKGQYFFGRGDNETDLEKAFAHADKAVHLDPNYAPAWALRSAVWNLMADFNVTNMSHGYEQARADAERAIVLNPSLAEGYLALGWIQMNHDWDWAAAEASLTKAADLEPGNADLLYCRSLLFEFQGRLVEAIDTLNHAISLDPLRARYYSLLGYQLYFSGKYDESDAALAKALELNPQKEQDHITRGELLLARGHAVRALAEMEQEPDKSWRLFGEALAYHRLGRAHDSDAALNRLIATGAESWACQIAQIYAYRGDRNRAFEWLDRAYHTHDGGLPYMKVDFILRTLSPDTRYSQLLTRMQLPA